MATPLRGGVRASGGWEAGTPFGGWSSSHGVQGGLAAPC